MLLLIRPLVMAFLVLSVIYLVASVWSRVSARIQLGREWDEGERKGDRDQYIEDGLAEYEASLKRRLLLLIYVIPMTFFAVVFYAMNYL